MGNIGKKCCHYGGVVMQSLTEIQAGEVRTIKWMFGNPGVLDLMRSYGFEEGSLINVFRQGKDGLIIGHDNLRLAIGYDVAERIKV